MRRKGLPALTPAIGVYVDSSVFGGVYDREFERGSRAFFDLVRRGVYRLVLSTPVRGELEKAPENVRRFSREFTPLAEALEVPSEAVMLQEAYLRANVLTTRSRVDALHVALATVADAPSL